MKYGMSRMIIIRTRILSDEILHAKDVIVISNI